MSDFAWLMVTMMVTGSIFIGSMAYTSTHTAPAKCTQEVVK